MKITPKSTKKTTKGSNVAKEHVIVLEPISSTAGAAASIVTQFPEPSKSFFLGNNQVMESLAKHLSIGVSYNSYWKTNTGTKFLVAHTMESSGHSLKNVMGKHPDFEVWQVYVKRVASVPSGNLDNYKYWAGKKLIK